MRFIILFVLLINLNSCGGTGGDGTITNSSWIRQIGKTTKAFLGADNTKGDECYDLAKDQFDNVYCAGYTEGSIGESNGGGEDAVIVKYDAYGRLQWIRQFGSITKASPTGNNSGNERCEGISVDKLGNIYCVGYTSGNFIEANAGGYDTFIIKLNPNGEVIWAKQLGANSKAYIGADHSQNDYCAAIATDSKNNVYASCYTEGSVGETNGGSFDVFVLKLNSNGSIGWATQLGNTTKGFAGGDNSQQDSAVSIAIDGMDNIYFGGSTLGSIGEANAGGGSSDLFIIKLNKNGIIIWSRQLGALTKAFSEANNSGGESCEALTSDRENNVYCAGSTTSSLGEVAADFLSFDDLFILKINSSGNVQWLTQLGADTRATATGNNQNIDACRAVTTDSTGNIYCAGYSYSDMAISGVVDYSSIVMKLNREGTLEWLRQFYPTESSQCLGVAIGTDNSIYCGGLTGGSLGEEIASPGSGDIYIMKLTPEGVL